MINSKKQIENESQGSNLGGGSGMKAFKGILAPLILAATGVGVAADLQKKVQEQEDLWEKDMRERREKYGTTAPPQALPPVAKPCPPMPLDMEDYCRWRPGLKGCQDNKYKYRNTEDATIQIMSKEDCASHGGRALKTYDDGRVDCLSQAIDRALLPGDKKYGNIGNDPVTGDAICNDYDVPPCRVSDALRELCDKDPMNRWCSGQQQEGVCYDEWLSWQGPRERAKREREEQEAMEAAAEAKRRKRGLIQTWKSTRGCSYVYDKAPAGTNPTLKTPCNVPFEDNAKIGDIAYTGSSVKTPWRFLGWAPDRPYPEYTPEDEDDLNS